MFKEKEIVDAYRKVQDLPKEELDIQFKELLQKQSVALSFIVANVEQYKLEEDTKNAAAEMLFHIFNLYKIKKVDSTLTEESIAKALNLMDVAAKSIENEIGGLSKEDVTILNKAIESGKSDKLTGKPKVILDAILNKKKEVKQPILLEFLSNYIFTDQLIIEKDKSFVFSIAETIVEAIEIQNKQ